MTLDQETDGGSVMRHRGCIVQRLAGNEFFRRFDERNDLLLRLLHATLHSGQCERGAHELQELPPRGPVVQAIGVLRKLAPQWHEELFIIRQFFESSPELFAALIMRSSIYGRVDFWNRSNPFQ